MAAPNQPGFVFNQQQPTYPQYPPQNPAYPPQNNAYPTQNPSYPQPQTPAHQQPPPYQHQPFPAPIQRQPGPYNANASTWFANQDFQNYLRNATSFHVKQKVELLEVVTGWESANKYTVKDQSGNKVFTVQEESNCCARLCLVSHRPFDLSVRNTQNVEVLRISRELDCGFCCCGLLCPDTVSVTAMGVKIGTVEEKCSILFPKMRLKDANGQKMLKLEGPACPIALGCAPVVFKVTTNDGVPVGSVSKEWGGLVRELFTDADFFSISFPADLDPNMKALCLGALFLIDFQYFEGSNSSNQGGRRLFG